LKYVATHLCNVLYDNSQADLQLWRTYMIAKTKTGLGKTLKRMPKSKLQRDYIYSNRL